MAVELTLVWEERELEIEPSAEPGAVDDGPIKHDLLHHLAELTQGRIPCRQDDSVGHAIELEAGVGACARGGREVLRAGLVDGEHIGCKVASLAMELERKAIGEQIADHREPLRGAGVVVSGMSPNQVELVGSHPGGSVDNLAWMNAVREIDQIGKGDVVSIINATCNAKISTGICWIGRLDRGYLKGGARVGHWFLWCGLNELSPRGLLRGGSPWRNSNQKTSRKEDRDMELNVHISRVFPPIEFYKGDA